MRQGHFFYSEGKHPCTVGGGWEGGGSESMNERMFIGASCEAESMPQNAVLRPLTYFPMELHTGSHVLSTG